MTDDPRWYAVVTRPRAEAQADRNLRRAGFWTFFPSERFKQRVGVKKQLVDRSRPMLPRYLFVALRGRQALGTVRDTVGVSDLVRFGGDPVEIPHGVLNALMARVDADGPVIFRQAKKISATAFVGKVGDNVVMADDKPLFGLVARIASIDDLDTRGQISVWIKMLGVEQAVPVPISAVAEIIPMGMAIEPGGASDADTLPRRAARLTAA